MPQPSRFPTFIALALLLALRGSLPAHAQAPVPVVAPAQPAGATNTPLANRLAALIEKSGLGGGMGAVVADAWTGQRLYTLNPEVPRNPASNMKLLTAATVLTELGSERRLRTSLYGRADARGRVPSLVVRGEGDPSLTYADLLDIARRLRELGVRQVDEVVIDGSYFDSEVLPPAYEQQPAELAPFRAAVAALSVDRNAFSARVAAGAAADAPVQVSLQCPDHFIVDAQLTTSARGAAKVTLTQAPRGDRLALVLRGSVPAGGSVSIDHRVEAPLAYAGQCVRSALKELDVGGPQKLRVDRRGKLPPLLLSHESAALAVLMQRVGKNSDNFVAEMLTKVLGAEATHAPGSTRAGLARGEQLLVRLGVASDRFALVNGSGLFQGNTISPDALVALLLHAYRDPALRPEYLNQLAVGGKDGTLAGRLADVQPARVVRAKTGSLADVSALSGYVLGPRQEHALAFSFLTSGVSAKQAEARALLDTLVRALVTELYGERAVSP